MNEGERRAVLALWSFRGVGAIRLEKLASVVPRDEWLSTKPYVLAHHLRLKEDERAELSRWSSLDQRADEVLAKMETSNQHVCFLGEPAYPPLLVNTPDPPPLLFHEGPGATTSVRAVVSIVGTRSTNADWIALATALAADCSRQGLLVASGAAEGIDTAAHLGAVRVRGLSWAFIAQGLDEMDPNQGRVRDQILPFGGTIFTEYPPGHRPTRGQFVHRNRLIAGCAAATVMVRGADDSGAGYTTDSAFSLGRPVLTVPPGPFDRQGNLAKKLLKQGARACYDVSDVLEVLGLTPSRTQLVVAKRGEITDESRAVFERLPTGLFDMEEAVAALPLESSGTISAALMELELAGWVVQKTGRRYEKRE